MKVVTTEKRKVCFLTQNDPEELPPVEVWRKTKIFSQVRSIYDIPEDATFRDVL